MTRPSSHGRPDPRFPIPAELTRLLEAAGERLAGARRVVLTTHITPDGDGLGSALALVRHLRARGAAAEVVNCSAVPHNLRFLYQKPEFSVYDPQKHDALLRECDAIVATDIGGSARLGKMEAPVRASPATRIVIDHHLYDNDLFDIPVIWTGASSSAEITWHLILSMGGEVTERIAEPLYVGLVSDTGGFAYSATSPTAHRMAALLLEAGVDPYTVWRKLFCQTPLPKMRLLGNCLSRLRVEHADRVVWTAVDIATLNRNRLPARDAFEVVNHFLQVKGVLVGAFFLEIDGGRTKVSLRSTGEVDVCAIAKRHGGGGHRFASGCTVQTGGLQGAIEQILGEIRDALPPLDVAPAPGP